MYTIRKKFKFEAAHVLSSSYSEECQQIHGHSYVLEVIIKSTALNEDGMVIDFKNLKEIVNKKVIEVFDHQLITDPDTCIRLDMNVNHMVADYNPTAENMCFDIVARIGIPIRQLISEMVSLEVRLHETSTGWASYKVDCFLKSI